MAAATKKIKKITRYALSGLFVIGMICVTGFLSFTGMLFLNASIYFAVAAFFLAGGIEGEVYAQNISASLIMLFTGQYWEDVIIDQLLNKLLNNNPSSTFLKEYKALQDFISEQEEDHGHGHDHGDNVDLKEAKRNLKLKKRYFRDFIMKDANAADAAKQPFHEELNNELAALLKNDGKKHGKEDIRNEILQIRSQIRRKILLSRAAWILNIGAGISCLLVGLEVAQSSIAALSTYFGVAISGAALSASIFGLAIVGAIGYMLLIHNTITDMIKDDTLRSWAAETRDFFKRKNQETALKYVFRITLGSLAVAIVVGLGVFATVATAGTWWHAAKAGAKFIPWISSFASELRAVAVSFMGITSLMFGIVNSLRSVKELAKISFHHSWEHIKKTIQKYKKLENWVQFLNPFRLVITLITVPFRFIVFIGHLFSMGIMGDKLDNIDPLAITFLATANEALQDVHYFLPEEEHHCPTVHDLLVVSELSQKNELKNTFVITQKNPQLIYIDGHGHQRAVFNTEEVSTLLSSLGLYHYLSQDSIQNPLSIKKELSKENLDKLNHMIHRKLGHHHQHDHGHGHTHADLVGKFLTFVLAPLYFLAAVWDYGFSQFNNRGKGKPNLTFKMARYKTLIGLTHKPHVTEKPILSPRWKKYEKHKRIEKIIHKNKAGLSTDSQKALKELQVQVTQGSDPEGENSTPVKFDSKTLLQILEKYSLKAGDKANTQKLFKRIIGIAGEPEGIHQDTSDVPPTKTQTSTTANHPRFFPSAGHHDPEHDSLTTPHIHSHSHSHLPPLVPVAS